jgi:hypothetical protein
MNNRKIVILVVALGLLVAGSVAAFSPGAIVEAVRSGVTSVGPSFPRHERITCDTTAGGVDIKPAGAFQLVSYECKSAGTVFVGSTTGAGNALTTANGVEFGSGDRFGGNVQRPEKCIVSAGSVVLSCRFLVTSW